MPFGSLRVKEGKIKSIEKEDEQFAIKLIEGELFSTADLRESHN